VALAKALDNGQEGYYDGYLANLRSLERNIMFKNLKAPAMYNKYLRKVIMNTGILSIGME
jgi:hypothetical protein